ncbi:MAG: class I SAM-dependent methyltransferase [Rhodobiaceae bacterium]|nr:class I SAM-dependent methyltransferase [Rhodobiaceae bacterium]MCC0042329.1 class I SAM-dependent methyltransferase [Rhodobiaceae bacterium]
MGRSGDIGAAFAAIARDYDAARPRLVPCFEAFYGTAVSLTAAALEGRAAPAITDLGAGTGLLAAFVAQRLPGARLTLIDLAGDMLAEAEKRLRPVTKDFTCVTADYSAIRLPQQQDAFVSALSIHHLADEAKQALFRAIHGALKPGGIFVNAEQVAPEPPATMADALSVWEDAVRAAGGSEAELAGARIRMTHDRCASERAQLAWLAEAGFKQVATAFRSGIFAVYSAHKPD